MDVVIDTLNVCHSLYGSISEDNIILTITFMSNYCHDRYRGRVMFVLKDATNTPMNISFKERLAQLCKVVRCYMYICERIDRNDPYDSHQSLGRDDFMCAVIAKRYHCPVISNDKMRDFAALKRQVPPFYLTEFSFVNDRVETNYINPQAEIYMKKLYHPTIFLLDDLNIKDVK